MRLLKRRPKEKPDVRAEIDRLTEVNRAHRDPETERRLLRLRHEAAIELLDDAGPPPGWPEPELDRLPASEGLPEVPAAELTPGLVRAGILRDGCVLVRGLIPRDEALRFAGDIDRAFAERDRREAGEPGEPGLYEEFLPDARFEPTGVRHWVKLGGGVLAADSPALTFQMMELLHRAGLPELVEGYLGEPGLISLHKTTLRKADPSVPGAWHQDGAFMGPVRALNLWLSLSRCGDESPGLDLVPRRLDQIVATQTDEAVLDYQVSQAKAEEAAGEKGIVRPIFEPGDALLFDELFLHQTGSDPSMPKPRFALENWFFGPSAFPDDYAPIAV